MPKPLQSAILGRSLGGGGRGNASKRGPLKTIFGDPPKAVSAGVTLGKFWEFLRDLIREKGGGQKYRDEQVPICPKGGAPFVPRDKRSLFVPDTVPPKMFMFAGFFLYD